MKKLLYLLLLIPFTIFGQSPSIYLQNGAIIYLKGSGADIYVQDGTTTAIQSTGTSGFNVVDNGVGSINWNIQNNSGTYTIPFISSANEKVPVTIDITSPGTGTYIKVSNVDGPSTNYPTFWDPNSINRYWTLNFDNYTTLPTGNIILGWTYNDVPTSYLDVQLKYYKDVYSGVWTNNELATNNIPSNPTLLRTTTFPINQYLNTLNTHHTWTLVNPNTPLPVELVYLRAFPVENKWIQVEWETATEINNSGFVVERSGDGITWDSLGWVQGANNSTQTNDYRFPDNNVIPNTTYYYRLKQVDNDGAFEYTDIVSARITSEITIGEFIPNPTNHFTRLNINTDNSSPITFKTYDVLGREVNSLSSLIMTGQNTVTLDVRYLSDAAYTVVIYVGDQKFSRRLIITK